MKRAIRKFVAILAGLILGWSVAGGMSDWTSHSQASQPDTHDRSQPSGPISPHSGAYRTAQGHGDAVPASDEGQRAARQLMASSENDGWYGNVQMAAGGLFAAAVLIGPLAMRMAGPEPAEDHPDHHDDAHHH